MRSSKEAFTTYMRRAFELAITAGERGNPPFGAVLVNKGRIVLEAENTTNTDLDFTRHAELNLVVKASREYSREFVEDSILIASTAPCPMCSYAMWSAGIRNVIYGVSYETYARLIPGKSRYIKCEQIYKLLQTDAEITGGILEEEGIDVYKHWPK